MISSSVTSLSAKLCNGNAIVSKTGPISAGVFFNFVFFNYRSAALAAIGAGVQHEIFSEHACIPTHTFIYRFPKITSPGTILRIC